MSDYIGHIIRESIKNVLNEGITDVVYHFCNINYVEDICENNELRLTMGTNRSDAKYNMGKFFYLSLSRTRDTKHSFGRGYSCRLQLDGYALKRDGYKGRPLNYWYPIVTKMDRYTPFEFEDRIVSDNPIIPNAEKYVKRIDLYVAEDKHGVNEYGRVRKVVDVNNTSIPIYVYDSEKDFTYQTRNTISLEKLSNYGYIGRNEHEEDKTNSFPYDELSNLLKIKFFDDFSNKNFHVDIKSYLISFGLTDKTILNKVSKRFFHEMFYGAYWDDLCFRADNDTVYGTRFIGKKYRNGSGILVQMIATDVLKGYGAKSFDDLALMRGEKKVEDVKAPMDEVICVRLTNQDNGNVRIYDGEYSFKSIFSVESIIDALKIIMVTYGNECETEEFEPIPNNSKNAWSFIRFVERTLNNCDTILDGTNFLLRFLSPKNQMYILYYTLDVISVDEEFCENNYGKIKNAYQVRDKLKGW